MRTRSCRARLYPPLDINEPNNARESSSALYSKIPIVYFFEPVLEHCKNLQHLSISCALRTRTACQHHCATDGKSATPRVSPASPASLAWYRSFDASPFENAHMDVSAVVALMANTSLADELMGVDTPDRVRAAQRWMDAESDVAAIEETMDMVLDGEEDDL